jgi:hypothetical protein
MKILSKNKFENQKIKIDQQKIEIIFQKILSKLKNRSTINWEAFGLFPALVPSFRLLIPPSPIHLNHPILGFRRKFRFRKFRPFWGSGLKNEFRFWFRSSSSGFGSGRKPGSGETEKFAPN